MVQRDAIVIRAWRVQDGGWRAQVRLDIPGKTKSRAPVFQVRMSYPPREGSRVLVREDRNEGWRVVD
jgi:hypothetical protein